jgi:predicted nucleic acid-binding protein
VLVVDASVLAPAIVDGGDDGRRFRQRLRGEVVAGPDLLRVEVISVVRRHLHGGRLSPEQATAAIDDLLEFPVRVFPTAPLLSRVWDRRDNLTAYDGCYASLAEALDVPLLTADRRLARAHGFRCVIEVM